MTNVLKRTRGRPRKNPVPDQDGFLHGRIECPIKEVTKENKPLFLNVGNMTDEMRTNLVRLYLGLHDSDRKLKADPLTNRASRHVDSFADVIKYLLENVTTV